MRYPSHSGREEALRGRGRVVTPGFPPPAVERYSPQENRWHTTAPMGTRRKHLGCAVYQDMIYAVGGRDDTTELSSAERFNPRANQWSPVVAMTSRRSGVSARYGDGGTKHPGRGGRRSGQTAPATRALGENRFYLMSI